MNKLSTELKKHLLTRVSGGSLTKTKEWDVGGQSLFGVWMLWTVIVAAFSVLSCLIVLR